MKPTLFMQKITLLLRNLFLRRVVWIIKWIKNNTIIISLYEDNKV